MAAYIDLFRVNQDATELTIITSTNTGETIQSLKLWTQNTFKDLTQAIDFSSKLEQTYHKETITITASELSESTLKGIYFVEVVDSTDPGGCTDCSSVALGVAVDLSRFSYCIIDYLCKMEYCCGECNQELHKALTMKLYVDGLKNSLQLGNFTTAISFWKNLDRVCKTECIECKDLVGITSKGLGFQTLGNELLLY